MTRTLYITDKMLRRKRACFSSRNQLNNLLGTRTRRVPVTFDTVFGMAMVTGRLCWATNNLLTNKQNKAFWAYVAAHPVTNANELETRTYNHEIRMRRDSSAFVHAYYSPKK